jgi:predicted AlkP superfamily phosphohydrolase/phosphomutase
MPPSSRVLAIGLDGYEPSLGDKLMAAGELPALARLRNASARFFFDHGAAQRTGLAWEHVSSGRSPEAAKRWSAVGFDPRTYATWHEGTSLVPFVAQLDLPTVVFDAPYFDLDRAPSTRGVVSWGAHDPGVERKARPLSLVAELESRFGPYPADDWTYGIVWHSANQARAMGDALVRATDVRAEAASWLLRTRLPDWRLGIVVAGELHSAIEGLWHGVDPTHPLHHLPSAAPAGEGLHAVYRAVDRLVGKLSDTFSDATIVAFAMGGMGPNQSDVASMLLLPELLYRCAFGQPMLRPQSAWRRASGGLPMLGEDEDWATEVNARIQRSRWGLMRRAVLRPVPTALKGAVRRAIEGQGSVPPPSGPPRLSIGWMPASRYQPYWHAMRYFALPSFYDGRIRINLAGRERDGIVPLSEYASVCDEVEDVVRACRDSRTGETVVDHIERWPGSDPRMLGPSESDIVIVWRVASVGFDHPQYGRMGPVPFRRTGGHTGPLGMAYISGEGIIPGDFGVRSSFDVVPTIIDLLGQTLPPGLSGCSLLARAPG